MSPFSIYKYHLGAWVNTKQNTRVLLKVFFFFSLYYLLNSGVHKVQRSFVVSIWQVVISWEWSDIALCSESVFSIRIALCVPQPKIFLLLSLFIFFIYYCYKNCCVRLILFDLYIRQYYYYSNNYYYIIHIICLIIF